MTAVAAVEIVASSHEPVRTQLTSAAVAAMPTSSGSGRTRPWPIAGRRSATCPRIGSACPRAISTPMMTRNGTDFATPTVET